ncbi:MAG: NADH-quinone oxidoreductase subunit NuoK [Thermoplasmatota archaeon]
MPFDIPLAGANWYFVLSVSIFAIGAYGIMTQRSGLKILMCVELLLNASNINFVAFANLYRSTNGYAYALVSIALAAAEAAVGLAILVNLFRVRMSVDADQVTSLRG